MSEQRRETLASQEVQQLCLYIRSLSSAFISSTPLSLGKKNFEFVIITPEISPCDLHGEERR